MTSALLVPQRAVTELQGSSQVRTVGEDNKVTVQTVTLGGRVGNRWIVQKGLDPGTRVIVDATTRAAGHAREAEGCSARGRPVAEELAMAAFFIRRPIVAIVIAIVTVLGGLVSHAAACRWRSSPTSCRRRSS